MEIVINKETAKKFILYKHGLLGKHIYTSSDIVKIVQNLGCIQYDPIDVCGTNPQLVLQSRIKVYSKQSLDKELYINRTLFEYLDKNLAIIDINDYAYFNKIRNRFKEEYYSKKEIFLFDDVNRYLDKSSYISSKDIKSNIKIDWQWSKTSIVRATLEAMYYCGDIVIHHRNNKVRYFSKADDIIPKKLLDKEDFTSELDYLKWRVFRRIKGVGLLWNKPSDAFLFIKDLNIDTRNKVFSSLKEDGLILEVRIDGLKDIYYIDRKDISILNKINEIEENRIEFIAPLDNLLWDRKLIKSLFDFDYKWEIYTKEENRVYGYYTLPILYNTNFIGRIEIICDRKENALLVKNIWFEDRFKKTKDFLMLLEERLKRFMEFNQCCSLNYSNTVMEKLK